MSQHEVDTAKGFLESDFMFNKQVSTLSLELLVRLLLHNNDDIAGLSAWELVSFAVERVLAVVWRTLVDRHIDDLLLFVDLLALASLALVGVIDHLALSATIVTRTLRLRVHARSELGHASHHTATTASSTLLNCAFFATEAIALDADALSVDSNLGALSRVDFLKSAFERVHYGLALLGA